jgi:sugar phosphate isomerase/epimerase
MNTRRRFGGLEFHLKKDGEGFTFHVKGDPEYQAAREDVFRMADELVREARRAGVTVAEILAHLARGGGRGTPPAANA